jgi:hypothetical protein
MSDFARLQELARAAGLQVSPPSVVDVPYVSPETAMVGELLNCTMGNWNGEPESYTYSWRHAGDPVEIGTGASYTTVAGDADTSVQCVVSATNSAGTASAPPSNSVAVTAAAAAATSASSHSESRGSHASAGRK